ncbi:fibronectin type III domain-containing protein [Hornefia butyriciproducens]|uniref:Fibronectin type III domain-containing protein n=1 Tax=Hornefia butyriciproducens TaxID=2652293 RepID=A0A6L5Y5B2_9FIRM|nr:fibronectin type III domain-containing protein [Hornefia butyriciproducens]MST51994.1 fibronectin type III domain-containing protein [Hornefia butyriciproducens]
MLQRRKWCTGIILAALAALLVIAAAAVTDRAYADEPEKCRVKIVVLDKSTGEEIKDATPMVYDVKFEGGDYVYVPVTPEEDGRFLLEVPEDEWERDYRYTYKAEAKGYKYEYKSKRQEHGEYIEFGEKPQDAQGNWTLTLYVKLTPQTEEERLNDIRTESKKALSDYKKASDYEAEDQETLKTLIQTYSNKIDDAKTEDAIKQALAEGKGEIDKLVTAQAKNNDRYASKLMFTDRNGKTTPLLTGEKGQYEASLSLLDKGGVFSVEGDPAARWTVKKGLWIQSMAMNHSVEYVTERTGSFLTTSIPDDTEFVDAEISDASVTLGDGSKVTFTLKISTKEEDKTAAVAAVKEKIGGIGEVTLDSGDAIRQARTDYDGLLKSLQKKVDNYDVLTAAEKKLEELKKAKEAKEEAEAKQAKAVDEKITAIGEVTLDSENAVTEARKAYDALSDGAKEKVTRYGDLTAAEKKLDELKTAKEKEEAEAKAKAEAEAKAKAEAERKAKLPGKVSLKVKSGKRKAVLSWKKTSKAKGYVVYRSTKKNGTYKKIRTLKSAKTLKYTNTKLKKGRTYYYKVCAYNSTGKGPMSSPKKVKVK